MTDFAAIMPEVARALWGVPNLRLSSKEELRWGTNGSRSVDIKKGVWHDHETEDGGGVLDLLRREGHGPEWLREHGFDTRANGHDHDKGRIIATYDYHDEDGELAYQVLRFEPKRFVQRRPDPSRPGAWLWNMQGVRRLPYHLPELIEAIAIDRPIFIVEGEKDVEALRSRGVDATCNSGGAGKWTDELSDHLAASDVVLIPDNDDAGRKHVEIVALSLKDRAKRVRILTLPGLSAKGDVSDWFAAGGTVERLHEIALAAPEFSSGDQHDDIQQARAPAFSDEALALRFAEQHEQHLRYVAKWGRWNVWTGSRWRPDDTLAAFNRAREICRAGASECNKAKIASALASAKTVAAVDRLARADRRLAATIDQWDADAWLLNAPDGVYDLRTGRVRPHRPSDYITKVTAVSPAKTGCPIFLSFLARITADDADLQNFLQRVFGYALTGSTRDHALFFGHGSGSNGKSVLLSTVAGIMGDYHRTAPVETFTTSAVDRHPTDLAGLHGARLVTAVETEEGRRWAESRVKALTGGDPVAARFMRQDFFEYVPQFKLFIAGNHKPGLRSVDEAIRRRFHLVPFNIVIPKEERDPQLAERMKIEWPGILQWMLEGCAAWQSVGLDPPPVVVSATAAYLEAEDGITTWLDEACERSPACAESSSSLFASWKSWAERSGETAGSQKKLTQALETRGFERQRTRTGAVFIGLRLLSDTDARWWDK